MNRINVLSYLYEIYRKYPEKIAFSSNNESVTFSQMHDKVLSIGTFFAKQGHYKKPIVVYMEKSPKAICAFFGCIAAGCYYVPVDNEMPGHRIQLIFETLKPEMVICDKNTQVAAGELRKNIGADNNLNIHNIEDIENFEADEALLSNIQEKAIDTDPVYMIFTSGSTGIPKGVIACHRSVIDYVENLTEVLGVTENSIFGNQAPLYVDACLKEIYSTLKYGATTYLIPKELFMFPVKLVEYINEHKINTVCWVVPALTLISSLGTFKSKIPESLHTIAFGSEVFPIKQFNLWKRTLPNCRFINLYGPTEGTGMSCYYEADREFEETEKIPIGKPFKNTEILLIGENNQLILPPKCEDDFTESETGEIYIRGTAVTLGYYNDPERTQAAFVQNPLNKSYPEVVYKTGDLAKYDKNGDLLFISRKDYQIKHMGHRIELGEIEIVANRKDGVECACCIFDEQKSKIVLYFVGSADEKELSAELKNDLPRYMVPSRIFKIDILPLTSNGKTDRIKLKEIYLNGKK